ncbi:MAG: hypothetical protein IPN86_12910 [Saprospiraceae bacterium]|nr:hypothetical protein [Saprospiraceae bacterium]
MLKHLIFILIIAFTSCKHQHHNHDSAELKSPLYNEVMAVHDAVMPEMATIHKLKKELKAIETSDNKAVVLDNIKALNDADEAMMTWMAAFNVPEDKKQEDEYLKAEKAKIQGVSDQMYGAMKAAATLIDSLKNIK